MQCLQLRKQNKIIPEIMAGHTGETIRILVDGELISAPRVQEPVTDGTCMISGFDSQEEAQRLVDALNMG